MWFPSLIPIPMFHSLPLRALLLAGIVVSSASLQSCSDDTTTNPPGTNTEPTVKPAVGSTYTFSVQQQDEDRVPVGSPTTEIFTVEDSAAVALNLAGYDFMSDKGNERLLRYESNGDVSVFFNSGEIDDAPSKWITIPFASKTSRTDTLIVDPSFGPNDFPLNIRATSTAQSDTTMTINGQSLKILRTEWKVTHDYGSSREYFTYDLWYAPKLGFFVKSDYLASGGFFGPPGHGEIKTLTTFTLK